MSIENLMNTHVREDKGRLSGGLEQINSGRGEIGDGIVVGKHRVCVKIYAWKAIKEFTILLTKQWLKINKAEVWVKFCHWIEA